MKVVFLLIVIIALGIALYNMILWESASYHTTIEFEQFKKFYSINPDKWCLMNSNVAYKTKSPSPMWRVDCTSYEKEVRMDGYSKSLSDYTYTEETGAIWFNFSFLDFIKYRKWKFKEDKEFEKQDKNNQTNKDMLTLLKCVQADIDELKEQAEKEYNQAINTMWEVANRMEENK